MRWLPFIAAAAARPAVYAAAPLLIIALELWHCRVQGRTAPPAALWADDPAGVLWLGRNFIAQGVAFSPDVTRLQQWSIWNNLTNPWFYSYIRWI